MATERDLLRWGEAERAVWIATASLAELRWAQGLPIDSGSLHLVADRIARLEDQVANVAAERTDRWRFRVGLSVAIVGVLAAIAAVVVAAGVVRF